MVIFPPEFVKIHIPGYYWNVERECLYSIKVDGVLKPLKRQPPFRSPYVDLPAGYRVSHKGRRITLGQQELRKRYNAMWAQSVRQEVDVKNAPPSDALKECKVLLDSYLSEFPEHDQGDYRVYRAAEKLGNMILNQAPRPKKPMPRSR